MPGRGAAAEGAYVQEFHAHWPRASAKMCIALEFSKLLASTSS